MRRNSKRFGWYTVGGLGLALLISCTEEARPFFLGGTWGLTQVASGSVSARLAGVRFTEVPIQERTFVNGKVVTTETYFTRDIGRTPVLVDFNGDGRVDPVVGYAQDGLGVVQILLSYGSTSEVNFASLTLDGGDNIWDSLTDIAVGDIDHDGALDLVVAAADGIFYLRHPGDPAQTQDLANWGQASGDLERINGTLQELSEEELDSLVVNALGETFDRTPYYITVSQGYTSVTIGDFNNDGENDIAASRLVTVTLEPRPLYEVEPIQIVNGSLQVLLNPGQAADGQGWTGLAVGRHERHADLDREGAADLHAFDLDGDGDLDLISTASTDDNVQVAWFENPGGPGGIAPGDIWTQHRIGSVRGAIALDVADLTGDGRVDVVAVSPLQMQMVLFVQPEEGAARGFDWYTTPIVTFKSFEPRAVKCVDLDNDGRLEVVVGGTKGAIRYFERPTDIATEWPGEVLGNLKGGGDIGLLGYGDFDLDGDADLITVAGEDEGEGNRVSWLRNEYLR